MLFVQQNSKQVVRQDLVAEALSGFAGMSRYLHAHRVLQVMIVMIVAHFGAGPVYGELAYKSDFESGAIRSKSSNPDGWLRQTMDATYPGGAYSYSDQVVASDGSVRPRAGSNFVRFEVRDGDNPLNKDFNPRAQLRLSPFAYEIDYGVMHWIGWSTYLPSAEFNPAHTSILSQIFINGDDTAPVWVLEYKPNLNALTHLAWHYPAGVRTKHESSDNGFGYRNPIPMYKDEWIDWRLEIHFSNDSNGKLILWQRRERESNFTKVAEHIGPIGRQSGDGHSFLLDVYGGGNWPLVAYYDEVRITNSKIGSAEEVDIPTGESPPKAPVLLE